MFAMLSLPAISSAQGAGTEDVASQIKAITDAHQEKMMAFRKKMKGISREEQRQLYQSEYPDPTEAVAAVSEIVLDNPREGASLDGIKWLVGVSRGKGINAKIFRALEEHHLDNEKLVELTASLMYMSSPEASAFLKTASEKSRLKDVRGIALYCRAMSIARDTDRADEFITLIETFTADHPDLELRGRNLAESVGGKLFAAKNLGIGKVAPEIIGKDVDGNEMKLSDYRGKVVVLDFWGDW